MEYKKIKMSFEDKISDEILAKLITKSNERERNRINNENHKITTTTYDYNNDKNDKEKPFILLVKKRIRVETEEQTKDKVFESFDRIKLDNTSQEKIKKKNKEVKKKEKTTLFIEENKNEFHFKDEIHEKISNKRKFRIFSSNPNKEEQKEIGDINKYFSTFYPNQPDKEFFQKERKTFFNKEVNFRMVDREKKKQEDFWERRKNLKGHVDPAFNKVRLLFQNNFNLGEEVEFIDVDEDRMLIISRKSYMKQHEIEKFSNILNENGLTPAVQLYDLNNNLALLNTQELVNEEDYCEKHNYYAEDDYDSNDENNPDNDYPDENNSDEFDDAYNTRQANLDDDDVDHEANYEKAYFKKKKQYFSDDCSAGEEDY